MTPAASLSRRSELVARRLLTGVLAFFAVWTLCYQLALLLGVSSTPTLAFAVAVTVLVLVLARGLRLGTAWSPRELVGPRASIAVVAATAVGTAVALSGHRSLALTLLLVASAVGLVLQALHTTRAPADPPPEPEPDAEAGADRWLWPTAWAAALVSGLLASVIIRPNGDDAYFVNVSTWVAERGRFPLHDTMLSQDRFPGLAIHSPPLHSIEALIGACARVLGIEAGTATYVLLPPFATVLAVLALALLIAEARLAAAPLGLLAAVGFLWTGGASSYSFANFFAVRIWQGKALMVSLFVPLLVVTALWLIRRSSLRAHLLFGAAVVGAVGASNTATFLVPLIVVGMAFGLVALRRWHSTLRVLVWMAYPLAVGVLSALLAPTPPTTSQKVAEGFVSSTAAAPDPGPLATVPGGGMLLAVTCVALGLGALGIRDVVLRTCIVGTMLSASLALHPLAAGLMDAAGIGSVVWRFWWAVPVPFLVAAVVSAAATRSVRAPALVGAVTAAALVLGPLVGGQWTGAAHNDARLGVPWAWKTPPDTVREARAVERISKPGDTVLVPWYVSRVLAALTVDVQPVSARREYLQTYASDPGAHAGSRFALQVFADERTPATNTIEADLDLLSVDTACVAASRGRAVRMLEDSGFREVEKVNDLVCLRR